MENESNDMRRRGEDAFTRAPAGPPKDKKLDCYLRRVDGVKLAQSGRRLEADKGRRA